MMIVMQNSTRSVSLAESASVSPREEAPEAFTRKPDGDRYMNTSIVSWFKLSYATALLSSHY